MLIVTCKFTSKSVEAPQAHDVTVWISDPIRFKSSEVVEGNGGTNDLMNSCDVGQKGKRSLMIRYQPL